MVWGLYRLCPLFGLVVASVGVCLGCGARDGLPGGHEPASPEVADSGVAPPLCSGLLPDAVPNADCGTLSYRLCPVGAPNPDPGSCSPGMRATDPEVWCCGGYVPPAGCQQDPESARLQLCAPGQAALIVCPGANHAIPFAGCTGPVGQDAAQVTGSDWCCP